MTPTFGILVQIYLTFNTWDVVPVLFLHLVQGRTCPLLEEGEESAFLESCRVVLEKGSEELVSFTKKPVSYA